jgi:amino acid transporter
MVGGGIVSTLGVVVGQAGPWAWLSFVVASFVALLSGYSYVKLAKHYGEGGGAFTFLRKIDADGFAGGLSWVLIGGYVLTNAVYASTFGKYLGEVVGLGPWFPRVMAVTIVAAFVALNLRGAGAAGRVEVVLVWFKLVVLAGLAAWGLGRWDVPAISQGVTDAGPLTGLADAASVFIAFEGFQWLTYDYDELNAPDKTLPRVVMSSIVVVTALYVAVAIGVAMLLGADTVVEHGEVTLALASREAAGVVGLVIVTIAAAFSTGSAIHATLFSTARLASLVAENRELPAVFDHHNGAGVPVRAVLALGGCRVCGHRHAVHVGAGR